MFVGEDQVVAIKLEIMGPEEDKVLSVQWAGEYRAQLFDGYFKVYDKGGNLVISETDIEHFIVFEKFGIVVTMDKDTYGEIYKLEGPEYLLEANVYFGKGSIYKLMNEYLLFVTKEGDISIRKLSEKEKGASPGQPKPLSKETGSSQKVTNKILAAA
ncbi:MAG: hypothetical protein ABIB11_02300, partial [Candidatus Omnitrophota bacterium]